MSPNCRNASFPSQIVHRGICRNEGSKTGKGVGNGVTVAYIFSELAVDMILKEHKESVRGMNMEVNIYANK